MSTGVSTFRSTVMGLLQARLYTFSVVLILAAILAMLATVASLNNLFLYTDLPYPKSNELIEVHAKITSGDQRLIGNAPKLALEWEQALSEKGRFALARRSSASVRVTNLDQDVPISYIDQNYFEVLGVAPKFGKDFGGLTATQIDGHVAVVSAELAGSLFGADEAAIGKFMLIDGVEYQVIGVMAPSFKSPRSLQSEHEDVWLPLNAEAINVASWRFDSALQLIGRVREAGSVEAIAQQLTGVTNRTLTDEAKGKIPPSYHITPEAQSLRSAVVGKGYKAGFVMLGAAVLVALLGLSIVSSMLTTRLAKRRPELALHAVLGARGSDLVWNVTLEVGLLLISATLISLPISHYIIGAIKALASESLPRLDELTISPLFIVWLVVAMAVLGGTTSWLSVKQLKRSDIIEEVRGTVKGALGAGEVKRRQLLIAFQFLVICLTGYLGGMILLDAAGRLSTRVGYDEHGSAFLEIELPQGIRSVAAKKDLQSRLEQVLVGSGSAKSLAFVDMPPISKGLALFNVTRTNGDAIGQMTVNGVGQSYLSGIGMQLIQGRLLAEQDYHDHPNSVVLGESAAKLVSPGASPVGQQILIDNDLYTVVGVVNDIVNPIATMPGARLQGYIPFQQFDGVPTFSIFLMGISSFDPQKVAQQVHSIDPSLVVTDVIPTSGLRADLVSEYYVKAGVSLALVALSAIMVVAGVYAVISFMFYGMAIAIATRLAVGARSADLIRLLIAVVQWPLIGTLAVYIAFVGLTHHVVVGLFDAQLSKAAMTAFGSASIVILLVLSTSWIVAKRLINTGYQGLLGLLH